MKTTKPPPPPKVSHSPWLGYTSREHKRPAPLKTCPSLRCRRVKACIAAHDDLYCQRTHISHAEHMRNAKIDPSFVESHDLEFRRAQMERMAEQRILVQKEKLALWKAGALNELYGPYRAAGVVKYPPKRVFED